MYPNQNQPMPGGYPPQEYGYPPQGQAYPNQGPPNPYIQPMIIPSSALHNLSGFDKLLNMPGIFVKQKFQLLQALTGCETQNHFVVYPANQDGSIVKDSMFKAKEKSNCLARQCLSGHCRPFNVKVEHEGTGLHFLWLHRECTPTCLCLNRPFLEVFFAETGKEPGDYIGKIVNPFKFCNKELQIFDNKNELKYIIWGDCCQLGFWCKFPCEACQTIDFNILDGSRNPTNGRLQKRTAGCLKSAVSDTTNFSLVFPTVASKEERALLMAAVIMCDFMYFEENPNQQRDL